VLSKLFTKEWVNKNEIQAMDMKLLGNIDVKKGEVMELEIKFLERELEFSLCF
jgi:hypothetical protein